MLVDIRKGLIDKSMSCILCSYILHWYMYIINTSVYIHNSLSLSLQVLDEPVQVLHVDRDLVVVNKPPSIPVHPISRFRVSHVECYIALCSRSVVDRSVLLVC